MKDTFENDSFITGAVYDDETLRMIVFIGDKSYECEGVPVEVWNEFKSAPSKGSYFNRSIKGLYNHEYFS